jgi:hypothetical protein
MGWERKRGKLGQFNRFLRGKAADAFWVITGNTDHLRGVRYVITLDSDTVLPRDAAQLLVGAMAHPLNKADFDQQLGRIVRGYGIFQPRVGVSLTSAHASRFAAVHSGHPGVDPYTTAVSDVYQDLFSEGSFTGKGIYDVDAFEKATHGRFPENTLLSHDLIEGAYSRAGLLTDIEVYDDYPAISHIHKAKAPLDSWRLAASAMAREERSGSEGSQQKPPLGNLALEDLRQSSAKPHRDITGCAAGCRMVLAAGLDAVVVSNRSRRNCGAMDILTYTRCAQTAA